MAIPGEFPRKRFSDEHWHQHYSLRKGAYEQNAIAHKKHGREQVVRFFKQLDGQRSRLVKEIAQKLQFAFIEWEELPESMNLREEVGKYASWAMAGITGTVDLSEVVTRSGLGEFSNELFDSPVALYETDEFSEVIDRLSDNRKASFTVRDFKELVLELKLKDEKAKLKQIQARN